MDGHLGGLFRELWLPVRFSVPRPSLREPVPCKECEGVSEGVFDGVDQSVSKCEIAGITTVSTVCGECGVRVKDGDAMVRG